MKLNRRIQELKLLDVKAGVPNEDGRTEVARSNVRETIREVFGLNSPEYTEYKYIDLWEGPVFMGMDNSQIIQGTDRGRRKVIGVLSGLIDRLKEKREDFGAGTMP